MKILQIISILIISLFILLVGALFLIPKFVPLNKLLGLEHPEEMLDLEGFKTRINQPISYKLFPSIVVIIKDTTLSSKANPNSFFNINSLSFKVNNRCLFQTIFLSGKCITEINVDKLVGNIEKFSDLSVSKDNVVSENTMLTPQRILTLELLNLNNAHITYNKDYTIENIAFTLNGGDFYNLQAQFESQNDDFHLMINSSTNILQYKVPSTTKHTAEIKLTQNQSETIIGNLKFAYNQQEALSLLGSYKINDLQNIVKFLPMLEKSFNKYIKPEARKKILIEGDVEIEDKILSLTNIYAEFLNTVINSKIILNTQKPTPDLAIDITSELVNLNNIITSRQDDIKQKVKSLDLSNPQTLGKLQALLSNTPLPSLQSQKTINKDKRLKWSDKKIDFDLFDKLNLKFSGKVSLLKYKAYSLQNNAIVIDLKDGSLRTSLDTERFLSGNFTTRFNINRIKNNKPFISLNINSDGVKITDIINIEKVIKDGTISINTDLRSTGYSQKELVNNLNGYLQNSITGFKYRGDKLNLQQINKASSSSIINLLNGRIDEDIYFKMLVESGIFTATDSEIKGTVNAKLTGTYNLLKDNLTLQVRGNSLAILFPRLFINGTLKSPKFNVGYNNSSNLKEATEENQTTQKSSTKPNDSQ